MYLFYLYHADLKRKVRVPDPVGWDGLGKQFKREKELHGVFFEYTPRLQFIKQGRAIIQTFYEKYGIRAQIFLDVYKKNKKTRHYDQVYYGRVNTRSIVISTLFATCNFQQLGFIDKFKNRKSVKVDMKSTLSQEGKEMSILNGETVALPSKEVRKRFLRNKQYRSAPPTWDNDETYNIGSLASWNLKNWKSLTNGNLGNTPQEGVNWTEATFEELAVQILEIEVDAGHTYYIIPSLDETTVSLDEITTRIKYPLHVSELNPVDFAKYEFVAEYGGVHVIDLDQHNRLLLSIGTPLGQFELVVVYGKGGNYTEEIVGTTGPAFNFSTDLHQYDETYTVQLQPNDEVYVFWRLIVTGGDGVLIFTEDYITDVSNMLSILSITADTVYADSEIPLMLMHESFARVCESITDTKDCFYSTYFGRTNSAPRTYASDGPGALRGISPGKLIRGFPPLTNHIYANFQDLFASAAATDGVGVGIERINGKQMIVVEKLSHFYQNVKSTQIPWVRDIEKAVLEDYYYNAIEGGYDKWGDEAVGNLDEPNAKREFTLPISEVDNKLVLKSPYPASSYLIEQVRRDSYLKSSTKDNKFDSDNFLFQLRRITGGYAVAHNEDFTMINLVLSPSTLLNVDLSPMRCIVRNGAKIRGGLLHEDDKNITLAFGEANTSMLSRKAGEDYAPFGPLNENSIKVSELDRPLWRPEAYQFDAPITQEQLDDIESNLYGYIEFAVDDKSWKKGYLLEMKPNPTNNMTSFKLLRANL